MMNATQSSAETTAADPGEQPERPGRRPTTISSIGSSVADRRHDGLGQQLVGADRAARSRRGPAA